MAKVALAMAYSPSAVSQQIALLESEVGFRLIEPFGRGVRLTAQGEILVTYADVVVSQLDKAESELVASTVDAVGTLKVAALQTVGLALIPSVIDRLQARFPALVVHVTDLLPDQTMSLLSGGLFDLVVGEDYPGQETRRSPLVHSEEVLIDPISLLVPMPWLQKGDVQLRDLASRPWAMEEPGKPAHEWALSQCRQAGFEPDIRYVSNDLLMHVRFVESCHAVAFMPGLLWESVSRTVPSVSLRGDPARRVLTAVREGAQSRPDVRAFRSELRKVADEKSGGTGKSAGWYRHNFR